VEVGHKVFRHFRFLKVWRVVHTASKSFAKSRNLNYSGAVNIQGDMGHKFGNSKKSTSRRDKGRTHDISEDQIRGGLAHGHSPW
jgi:hypothetical protein